MRVGVLTAVTACALAGLTGCSANPNALKPKIPVVSSSPTASPTALASPSPTDPPTPSIGEPTDATSPTDAAPTAPGDAASGYPATETGAYAIAEAIIREASKAGLSGDLTTYRTLATSDCPCVAKETSYIASFDGKGKLSGGEPSGFKHVAYTRITPALAQVFISYNASSTILTNANGAVVGRSAPTRHQEDGITLRVVTSRWLVTSINPLAEGTK